jgi:hypothetical protein
MEVSGQLHALTALPLGKEPRYPLNRRLGGPQSRFGRLGEDKILDPTGTRTPTPPPSNPQAVAIPTELSRLLVVSTRKYNTLKITVTIGHKPKSSTSAYYPLLGNEFYLVNNSTTELPYDVCLWN